MFIELKLTGANRPQSGSDVITSIFSFDKNIVTTTLHPTHSGIVISIL